ncbi:MAG: HlyD family efflux transporter periplasmic adaptor subunit [Flavobacteriaceae bacterium]
MKQIFPKEIIDSTVEVHQFKHTTKSKIIYSIILLSILIILVLLPFIKVDIYTSARGIIKPDKERLSITSLNSGKVLKKNIKNNALVHKGDTLLVLDNTIINEKLKLSSQQIADIRFFIEDLTYLVNTKHAQISKIQSPKYKKDYLLYQQKMHELQTRFKKLKQDFERSILLYKKGVIAKVEFENTKFEYNLAISSINQLKQQQLNTWQASLTEYENSLLELESANYQLQDNKSQFIITAPIKGTLISLKSIEIGSFLSSGQPFGEISPDTNLLVECYISPQDIGLLKLNNAANFQIDAFNYNQWGLASGKIIDIGKDIEFIDNTSVFKIQCHINQTQLILKNGFIGKLKKGMTLNAQFKLTERTLFDLLYDKVDDWVNPSQKRTASVN